MKERVIMNITDTWIPADDREWVKRKGENLNQAMIKKNILATSGLSSPHIFTEKDLMF